MEAQKVGRDPMVIIFECQPQEFAFFPPLLKDSDKVNHQLSLKEA